MFIKLTGGNTKLPQYVRIDLIAGIGLQTCGLLTHIQYANSEVGVVVTETPE